jgi:hypothetical protein
MSRPFRTARVTDLKRGGPMACIIWLVGDQGRALSFSFIALTRGLSNWHARLRRSGIGTVTCAEYEQGDAVPNYMLLLYAPEVDEVEQAARDAEMPAWFELNEDLRTSGFLVANDRLHPVAAATTVRVRDSQTELIDGPFAVTKEILVGYYLLDCPDLDEALKQAGRLPLARYGSVEVRPIMPVPFVDQAATD